MILSASQIADLARRAGFPAASVATAVGVALAESAGRTGAKGDIGLQDSKWGPSVGLWQVRSLKADYGTGRPRDESRLTDPEFNAHSALIISSGGQNWNPWTTFTSGKYRQYLPALQDTPFKFFEGIPLVSSVPYGSYIVPGLLVMLLIVRLMRK